MKKILAATLLMLAFSTRIFAQVYSEEPSDAAKPKPSIIYPVTPYGVEVIQEKIYEPAPVTVRYTPEIYGNYVANTVAGSFSQENAWNLRNNFGFSLHASDGYYFRDDSRENPNPESTRQKASSAASLSANVFTNYRSGNSAMHLDYGAGYRFYPERENSINGVGHNFSGAYMYQISDRARLQLRDHLSSYSNDPLGDFFSINSSFDRLIAGSNYYDILLSQRRHTRNTLSGSLSSDVTGKRTNVRIFGSYDNYWYGEQEFEDGKTRNFYSAKVGASVHQGITSWLSLGSSYSIQLNNDLKEYQIHRVDVGNLQFELSPSIEVHASGGVEITESGNSEGYRTRVAARAGISYSNQMNRIYADYSRTMMSVSGFNRRLPSDTYLVGLGQPIGERANLRVTWYYQRSYDFHDDGHFSAYQGMASMEYIIISGLYASVNYTRRYQENSINSLAGIPASNRSMFSFGLSYSWPSGRRR